MISKMAGSTRDLGKRKQYFITITKTCSNSKTEPGKGLGAENAS